LRKALEGEQFELYYQPQIEILTGKIVGVEALIRWNHPTLGMLGPAHSIGVAEEAGLIMGIWEWVLVAALIQHNAWLAQGLPKITVAVNLSSVQFSDPALAERIEEIARVVGVPLDYLEFEVTESMLLVDSDAALKTLTALRAMGVKIAIDDFGTGYSSLSYLRRLPLDKLKLDQSFIRDAGHEGDVAITRAIIADGAQPEARGGGRRRGNAGAGRPPPEPGLHDSPGLPARPPLARCRDRGLAARERDKCRVAGRAP